MTTVTNEETNSTYFQVEMRLNISINQLGAEFELVIGETRDLLGQTGAAGSRLAFTYVDFNISKPVV